MQSFLHAVHIRYVAQDTQLIPMLVEINQVSIYIYIHVVYAAVAVLY